MIAASKRWPLAVILILALTICVNLVFIWIAVNDSGGGFKPLPKSEQDSSYKMKVPLEPENLP